MLVPSSQPPRIPPSTVDSQYDTTTGYSSSSYTRWSRSQAKSRQIGRTTNSISRRRYQYPNEPRSDILHYQSSRQQQQQQPINSTTTPRQSAVNNLLP